LLQELTQKIFSRPQEIVGKHEENVEVMKMKVMKMKVTIYSWFSRVKFGPNEWDPIPIQTKRKIHWEAGNRLSKLTGEEETNDLIEELKETSDLHIDRKLNCPFH
jgi:hypothetical protein